MNNSRYLKSSKASIFKIHVTTNKHDNLLIIFGDNEKYLWRIKTMVSLKYLDSIFNTSEINFKNTPEEIIFRIDDLLSTVDKEDVLLGLTELKTLFDERVNQGRRFGGSSGSAMQELMIDEMKQFYLSMVKDYVGTM